MPLPYTGSHGELNFEADLVDVLIRAGWENEVIKNPTVHELIENWRNIIFERNRTALNNVPLSNAEMDRLMDYLKSQAATPVDANHLIDGNRDIAIKRDDDSVDTAHAGKDVYINLFKPYEIGGGSTRYQIAEQVEFELPKENHDRRGDVTLLINGMPLIHIELKASGVDVSEACEQIIKYSGEHVFRGFMGLVQIFWAITPEQSYYFANAGSQVRFNRDFFFHWCDENNKEITDWRKLALGNSHILSIPEAHKLIGYYCVADSARNCLRVCRTYQYMAIRALVERAANQKWGNNTDKDRHGGFIWHTTGSGKTLTSFKAGQLMIDMNLADKVVFVVDRKTLDSQSLEEYRSFQRTGEEVRSTNSAKKLSALLKSTKGDDSLIVTSIQKLYLISKGGEISEADLNVIRDKRLVFIVDEAHRSQFGDMHQMVEKMFSTALFFGFTGTPIFSENMKHGEQTTESVFGPCLAVYNIAGGIRDGNVLGFWPKQVFTYRDDDIKSKVAESVCGVSEVPDRKQYPDNYARYQQIMMKTPMASSYDDEGNLLEKGIEDYLPSTQYDNDDHRNAVVDDIIRSRLTVAYGGEGTTFSGMLATDSIYEAYQYWQLFRTRAHSLNVTGLFDPNVQPTTPSTRPHTQFNKEKAIEEIIQDYNRMFGTNFSNKTDKQFDAFKDDLRNRLARKKPYDCLLPDGNDSEGVKQCIDIIIVVDQLLTGYDSQYLNVLYLDKILETDGLIQAISRTNRVYRKDEKPWGMVRFYRKPYTMARNLHYALKLYCQGDYSGVEIGDLKESIKALNGYFADIKTIFQNDGITDFDRLPMSNEDRQEFRRLFSDMRTQFRAAQLQGFKWSDNGKDVDFDKTTYDVLTKRYEDAIPHRQRISGIGKKPPFVMGTNMSSTELNKINADYLESQFKIVTLQDIHDADYAAKRSKAINNILGRLNQLSAEDQVYAKRILADIKAGTYDVSNQPTLSQSIQEYREKEIRDRIKKLADQFGLDKDKLYTLYIGTGDQAKDSILQNEIESGADIGRVMSHFGCKQFKACSMLHKVLEEFLNPHEEN